jgi:hypothetical protein
VVSSLPDGSRHYSKDGRTVLVLSENDPRGVGSPTSYSARLFDVSRPLSPVPLTPNVVIADRYVITGALSEDGSRIALQSGSGAAQVMTVSIRDRALRERATWKTTAHELFFAGRYLVVGGQRGQRLLDWTTDEISIYDCSLLP